MMQNSQNITHKRFERSSRKKVLSKRKTKIETREQKRKKPISIVQMLKVRITKVWVKVNCLKVSFRFKNGKT